MTVRHKRPRKICSLARPIVARHAAYARTTNAQLPAAPARRLMLGMPQQPRSVKIGDQERGGWSSDRPRRPGEPERPPRKLDVSVRGRVLPPTDRMRYNPGSLVAIACADRALRDKFVKRAIEEQSAILSLDKARTLLTGKVPEPDLDAKAEALLDAAAAKRFAAGQSVVIPLEGLEADERERYVRLAAAH